MQIARKNFKGLSYLLSKSINDSPHEDLRPNELESRNQAMLSFYKTRTFEDAIDLARFGWPEGSKKIIEYTKTYSKLWTKFFPAQDFSQNLQQNISGSVPIVENFIQGIPEDMLEFEENQDSLQLFSGGKLQRIIVNCAVSHYISTETILQYGALIGALVNSMELCGFNVELNLVWHLRSSSGRKHGFEPSNTDKSRLMYCLIFKQFSQQLDLQSLAFVLAHASMFRRFIFSLMEQEEDIELINNFVRQNYGIPTNLTPQDIKDFYIFEDQQAQLGQGNMYFKLLEDNYNVKQLSDQCVAKVKEHFTEVNMNLNKGEFNNPKFFEGGIGSGFGAN